MQLFHRLELDTGEVVLPMRLQTHANDETDIMTLIFDGKLSIKSDRLDHEQVLELERRAG